MVAPLVVLGWMLVAGGVGTAADSIGNEGRVRRWIGQKLGSEAIEKPGTYLKEKADGVSKDLAYDNVFEPLGIDRKTFDEWWEKLDPTGNAGVFGGVFAGLMAIDKVLERGGIDLLDAKWAAILAISYNLLVTNGLGQKFLDYVKNTGIFDPAHDRPPGETPPRRDDHGFGDAADRPPRPRRSIANSPHPRPESDEPAPPL